jgi:hypothetical protein
MIRIFIALGVLLVAQACNDPRPSIQNQEPQESHETALAVPDSVVIATGKRMLMQAQDSLRVNLLGAIERRGHAEAVRFCNVKALPILSEQEWPELQLEPVSIRRTSLKWRNPLNEPDAFEREVLAAFQKVKLSGEELAPVVHHHEGQYHFFQPIAVQPFCLDCHGSVESNIAPPTLAAIDSLYPNDRARNYSAGDLRGMFHVVLTTPSALPGSPH